MKESYQQLNSYLFLAVLTTFILFIVSFSACKEDEEQVRTQVYIEDTLFNPSVAIVPAGGAVIWENDGDLVHTVTSDSGLFNSGDLAPDGTFMFTFEEPGNYEYHCTHHSSMTGIVVVQ